MVSLTIRNLQEDTKGRLRVRAAQNGRSTEEEARAIQRATVSGATPPIYGHAPARFSLARRASTSLRHFVRLTGRRRHSVQTNDPARYRCGVGAHAADPRSQGAGLA
jgi:plasmid stability protein